MSDGIELYGRAAAVESRADFAGRESNRVWNPINSPFYIQPAKRPGGIANGTTSEGERRGGGGETGKEETLPVFGRPRPITIPSSSDTATDKLTFPVRNKLLHRYMKTYTDVSYWKIPSKHIVSYLVILCVYRSKTNPRMAGTKQKSVCNFQKIFTQVSGRFYCSLCVYILMTLLLTFLKTTCFRLPNKPGFLD